MQIATDYSRWMAENDIPKLFVNAEPGAILIGAVRDFCRTWKNQTEVTVPGSHFIQGGFRACDRAGDRGVDERARVLTGDLNRVVLILPAVASDQRRQWPCGVVNSSLENCTRIFRTEERCNVFKPRRFRE